MDTVGGVAVEEEVAGDKTLVEGLIIIKSLLLLPDSLCLHKSMLIHNSQDTGQEHSVSLSLRTNQLPP